VPRGAAASLVAALQTVPPERRASWRMHKVESGETLATIGKRYGASPGVIALANRMESDAPETGDRLVIPQAASFVRPASKPVRRSSATSLHQQTAKKSAVRVTAAPKSAPKPGAVVKASRKRSASLGRT
jgi:hypothetical protein